MNYLSDILGRIRNIFKSSEQPASVPVCLDGRTNGYVHVWIKVFININKKMVYSSLDLNSSYEEYCSAANKLWEEMFSKVFSRDIWEDTTHHINKIISSENYVHYYKELFDDIRNVAFKELRHHTSLEKLYSFIKNMRGLYNYLLHRRSDYKVLHNIEHYGENVIFLELKEVLSKAINAKSNRQRK